jgi:hypothetical protein
VFLVGFMGAGKTATGEALAHLLGWRFVDLDARIEEREERSIAEIFKTDGESAFRQIETGVLGAVLAERKDRTVVALGGGAFSDPQNSLAAPPYFWKLRRRCYCKESGWNGASDHWEEMRASFFSSSKRGLRATARLT